MKERKRDARLQVMFTRYLARRLISPESAGVYPIETLEPDDCSWTFVTMSAARGVATIRRTPQQAERDAFEISKLVAGNAEMFERIYRPRPLFVE